MVHLLGSKRRNSTDSANDQDHGGRHHWQLRRPHPVAFSERHVDGETAWWFAGTAVPLLAATIGPLANLLSVAALVTTWRECLVAGVEPELCPYSDDVLLLPELYGNSFADPRWCYWLNACSLLCGCVGNLFILFNFTGFVRYIIALPLTILTWFAATFLLTGIMIAMSSYAAPTMPQQVYAQGFYYAILAAILYFIAAFILIFNMIGYYLGHYPERFELTDAQQTLVLQTMLFFAWIGIGAGIFSAVEQRFGDPSANWSFANAMYFANVTVLTIGLGDITLKSTLGRILLFPYAILGIVMLGLLIGSIARFASQLGSDKVVTKHQEQKRAHTAARVVDSVDELAERLTHRFTEGHHRRSPIVTAPAETLNSSDRLNVLDTHTKQRRVKGNSELTFFRAATSDTLSPVTPQRSFAGPLRSLRKPSRIILLEEERQRFNAMRKIQNNTTTWKRWTSLVASLGAFFLVWCIGALVFSNSEGYTYGEALYMCYVVLLTIGYGDYAPNSNAGRPFFVVWSLIAVATNTILVGSLGDTVISSFKRGTERIAELTILPKSGVLGELGAKLSALRSRLVAHRTSNIASGRSPNDDLNRTEITEKVPLPDLGSQGIISPVSLVITPSTIGSDLLAKEIDKPLSDMTLARRLSAAIQQVALDMRMDPPRQYNYDEWADFTTLIRFTRYDRPRAPHGFKPLSRAHTLPSSLDSGVSNGGTPSLKLKTSFGSSSGSSAGDGLGITRDEPDFNAPGQEEDEDELIEWDWIGPESPMMARQSEAEFVMDRLCESMGRFLRHLDVSGRWPARGAGVAAAVTPLEGIEEVDMDTEKSELRPRKANARLGEDDA